MIYDMNVESMSVINTDLDSSIIFERDIGYGCAVKTTLDFSMMSNKELLDISSMIIKILKARE